MKLAELGEFGFIERIRRAVAGAPGVVLGIGDDCAVLEMPAGERLLTSTDLLIEQIHFRREWIDSYRLGRKSVSVNVSDIAAMGGTPRHLYLGLGIPADLPVEELDAFISGFLSACRDYGATLVGGDTCRSPGPLLISVTVEGSAPAAEVVSRRGARPGDGLYVSGTLGDSALALRRLLDGSRPDDVSAARHHDPRAQVELGRALAAARLPTAMIDLSDGLLADLGHILEASAVGAEIEIASIPLSPAFRTALAEAPELIELSLSGGEDYQLLFTVPPTREGELAAISTALGLPLTRLGTVTAEPGRLWLRRPDGDRVAATPKGFNHFSSLG
ncbi:thiamine-phosphate kinase [Trichloromonas sp.]|uniref:thiamine-phosphate kinase n=1 Tax=Trichloromonas sp. TaxID=3069249 RepID=UPI002A45974A|nr:thiamine-phosphate kinase [Trichloromonas sp.]